MKRLNKNIILFIIPIIFLTTLSLLNLYYAPTLSSLYEGLFYKQIIWYLISIILFFLILKIKSNILIKSSKYLYYFNIILLILVLFIGKSVNGSKAWFSIGPFSFQPSEFMKLSLILYLTNIISTSTLKSNKDHIILLIRILLAFLLPSLLTFLEPDTGAIIIYFIITLGILFVSKIKKRYLVVLLVILLLVIIAGILLLIFNKELFTSIFGSSIYYRLERLTSFKNGSGMQIENALTTIGTAKFFMIPCKSNNLYFPEAATDFIFTLTINNFGIFGSLLILINYFILDFIIIKNIISVKNEKIKLITCGFLSMFLYQQIQNIFMNLGLLPIIGIPLPFLSYGGSSMILFFISLAIVLKLSLDKEKYSYRVFYN